MKNLEELDTPSPEEMKTLIAGLSRSERALLSDPNFITEDEADLIVSDRRMKTSGRSIPAEEVIGPDIHRGRRRSA